MLKSHQDFKAISVILFIQTQINFQNYINKILSILNNECTAFIIDTGIQNRQKIVKSFSFFYFHCPSETEKKAVFNDILNRNASTEKDIMLLDENILFSIPDDSSFFQKMRNVLYYTEKHGFVSPRINCDGDSIYSLEQIKLLPDFSIFGEPDIRCVLIKKRVIDLLVGLDNSYSSFLFAFKDFVQRANLFGFNPILCNSVLISCSDNYPKTENKYDKDQRLLLSQYQYYSNMNELFAYFEKHPLDVFINLYSNNNKKKILFYYAQLQPVYYGPSEVMLSVIDSFFALFKDKYDISIYTNHAADHFHKLSQKYKTVFFPDTISGVFDLGFCAYQPFFLEDQFFLNRYCLKSIYTIHDIIPLRSYIRGNNPSQRMNDIFRLGIYHCNGIITVSNFSIEDYKAYFLSDTAIQNKPVRCVYNASNFNTHPCEKYDLPFNDYFLIAGSLLKYKVLAETIEAVADTSHQFIVIGQGDNNYIKKNIFGYPGGHLSEDFISYLYVNCKAVIYPSVYEGFGLPIAIALKNKKRVIVYNNTLNKELYEHFSEFKEYFFFFDKFSQINGIINSDNFSKELSPVKYKDTWNQSVIEIEDFFQEILNTEIDIDRLNERWHFFNFLEATMKDTIVYDRDSLVAERNSLIEERDSLLNSRSWRFTRPLRKIAVYIKRYKILLHIARGLLSIKRKVMNIK